MSEPEQGGAAGRNDLLLGLNEFVQEVLRLTDLGLPPDLNPYDQLSDLGVDSVAILEIVVVAEELAIVDEVEIDPTFVETFVDVYDYYCSVVKSAS